MSLNSGDHEVLLLSIPMRDRFIDECSVRERFLHNKGSPNQKLHGSARQLLGFYALIQHGTPLTDEILQYRLILELMTHSYTKGL